MSRATLELRFDPESNECTRATVAAKMATGDYVSDCMLHQEAVMYTTFPRTLMEGMESLEELVRAHCIDETAANALLIGDREGCDRSTHKILPAVASKFYGYYLRLEDDGHSKWGIDSNCNQGCRADWQCGLLLVEEWGKGIKPNESTRKQLCVDECIVCRAQ